MAVDEPAVELGAVGGVEPDFFVVEAGWMPVAALERRNRVDEPGFEKRHGEHDDQVDENGHTSDMPAARRLADDR